MAKTHRFTQNVDGEPIEIVLDKIEAFKVDEFSGCTLLELTSGKTVGVAESIDKVRGIVEDA